MEENREEYATLYGDSKLRGSWLGKILTILVFAFLIAAVFVYLTTNNLTFSLGFLGFAIVIWILKKLISKHNKSKAEIIFMVFLILLALLGVFLYLRSTGYISNVSAVAVDTTLGAGEATGSLGKLAPSLNVVAAILTGKWNPDAQSWDSSRVKDSYVVPEDAGVVFRNIKPTRSTVYSDPSAPDGGDSEPLQISGDMDIISLFENGDDVDKTTQLKLSVSMPRCPDALGLTKIIGFLGASTDEQWCSKQWSCNIPGIEPIEEGTNRFQITKAFNQFFLCTHEGLITKNPVDLKPKVTWEYTTQAVSGKQIFVAAPDTLARIDNLQTHYNIPKASFEPWSISDDNVNFAMGFDQERNFLRAQGPANVKEGAFYPTYFLGVSLKNTGAGEISRIRDITIEIPNDENIKLELRHGKSGSFICKEGDQKNKDNDATGTFSVYNCELAESVDLSDDPIQPGFFKTFYMEFSINEDYLQGAAWQSFFAKAKVTYDYLQSKSTAVRVEPVPF